ncbi:MAG: DMT family transporter [Alphaproteobacteria bacterium]|nr:DMT family transporter [Alphaproteobacteria bacterium]
MTDQTATSSKPGGGTSNVLPYLLIVLAALIIASNHVLARYLGGIVPPMGMVFWRMVVGALFLLPITALGLFANRHLIFKHWKLFTLMGLLFVPLGNGLIYTAYLYTTAINGGVVSASQPAITVLLTWLMFRDVINWKQGIGIVIAGLGVLAIITRGDPLAILNMEFNKGDLIMLAAIAFAALYNVLIRKVPEQIPVPQLMVIVLVAGAVINLPLYILETIYIRPVPVTWVTVGSILWVGIAVTAIAVGLMSVVIRRIGANKASMSNYMRALLTALLAVVLLGEAFQAFHLIAMVLVIGGVFLMTRGRTPAT